jgi:hypothetical protein
MKLAKLVAIVTKALLKEYKDIFCMELYFNLKGIPPRIAQHCIELDTIIPPAHQAKY